MQKEDSDVQGRGAMETEQYLKPTYFIDCDSEPVIQKARQLIAGTGDPIERSKILFYFVRDSIKYNVYGPKDLPEYFRASATLARGDGYCVQKAVLLVALARAAGVPARLGFAMIRNNIMPPKLFEIMKTNIFPWHGYAQLCLNSTWIKATPTFDKEMCDENRIIPVEFDGSKDARFHTHNIDGELHIEYLKDRGPFDDVPLEQIWQVLRERRVLK
ncbi:MAG: transglutaminase domain-containing protein [Deltaproteobacteria bacterium]|nr:transglutaminase domain-containing protein [Deltaproteobacteria bacterium]